MKKLTVAIFGCGSRGETYASCMHQMSDRYEVVAACDLKQIKLDQFKNYYNLKDEDLFIDDDTFFEKKRADVLVIAVQDRDHVRFAKIALKLGYDLLLEKPISDSYKELDELLAYKNKYNRKVVVCHVLRYAPAYLKVKELLDSKICGDIVKIDATEQVVYWHQCHSYVRGNWHSSKDSTPMIMAKCCHDLDLLQYYAGSKCKYVSSFGDLTFFNKEHKPDGAADRCQDCKYINECPFSAENIYVKKWINDGAKDFQWPSGVVCDERPLTEEKIRKAYQNNYYGQCVFACDNDVVDYQDVSMLFENGIEANLTMTAFTQNHGRRYIFHCTYGEITLKEDEDIIEVKPYGIGKEITTYKISELITENNDMGHGGGDYALCNTLYGLIVNDDNKGTTLEASIESHLMALKAEESRKKHKMVRVH